MRKRRQTRVHEPRKRRTRVQELRTYSTRVHKSRKHRTSVHELRTRRKGVHQSRKRQTRVHKPKERRTRIPKSRKRRTRVLTPRTRHNSTCSTKCADAIITPRDEDGNDSLHRADVMTSSLCSISHTNFHALTKISFPLDHHIAEVRPPPDQGL